jgi:hypothetical protein
MSHKITDNWQKYLRESKDTESVVVKEEEMHSKKTSDFISSVIDDFGADAEGLYELVMKILSQMSDSEVQSLLSGLDERILDKEDGEYQASIEKPIRMKEESPCWDGYKQVGVKMKNGKEVPNCVPLQEKAVSKAQQRFMGAVKNCKETGDCPSPEIQKAADSMTDKEVSDFAGTKHKGLPNKVKSKQSQKRRVEKESP